MVLTSDSKNIKPYSLTNKNIDNLVKKIYSHFHFKTTMLMNFKMIFKLYNANILKYDLVFLFNI